MIHENAQAFFKNNPKRIGTILRVNPDGKSGYLKFEISPKEIRINPLSKFLDTEVFFHIDEIEVL